MMSVMMVMMPVWTPDEDYSYLYQHPPPSYHHRSTTLIHLYLYHHFYAAFNIVSMSCFKLVHHHHHRSKLIIIDQSSSSSIRAHHWLLDMNTKNITHYVKWCIFIVHLTLQYTECKCTVLSFTHLLNAKTYTMKSSFLQVKSRR